MDAAASATDLVDPVDGDPVDGDLSDGDGRGPTTADTSSARSLHHLTVVTPEGVVLDFRAAGVASRTLAKGLDLIIQFVALVAAIFIAAFMVFLSEAVAVIAIVVLVFLIFYGYPALLETWWDGRTIGKRLFGIKVITTEGGPVRLRHAAIRSMIATFDFFVPTPGGLVAVTFALLTKRSQRLGDLAAGTIVIREPKTGQAPVFFAPAYGAEAVSRDLDTSLLSPRHYTLIRELLLRAHELTPEARWELTEQLAGRIAEHTGNPRPDGLDGERYLVSILHAHQGRFGDRSPMAAAPPPWSGAPAPVPVPPRNAPPFNAPPANPPPGGGPPGGPPYGASVPGAGAGGPVDLRTLPPPSGPPASGGR